MSEDAQFDQAMDSMVDGDDWGDDGPLPRPAPSCRYCYSEAVVWRQVQGRWRLHSTDTGRPHTCEAYLKARAEQVTREASQPKRAILEPPATFRVHP